MQVRPVLTDRRGITIIHANNGYNSPKVELGDQKKPKSRRPTLRDMSTAARTTGPGEAQQLHRAAPTSVAQGGSHPATLGTATLGTATLDAARLDEVMSLTLSAAVEAKARVPVWLSICGKWLADGRPLSSPLRVRGSRAGASIVAGLGEKSQQEKTADEWFALLDGNNDANVTGPVHDKVPLYM